MPELDSMWQKLANNPQVLQHMFSLPYTKTVLEGFEASPDVAQQVSFSLISQRYYYDYCYWEPESQKGSQIAQVSECC